MSSRFVRACAALAAVAAAACESSAPTAPSLIPNVTAAAAASSTPDALHLMKVTGETAAGIVVNRGELDFARNAGVLSLYGTRAFALNGQ